MVSEDSEMVRPLLLESDGTGRSTKMIFSLGCLLRLNERNITLKTTAVVIEINKTSFLEWTEILGRG